MINLLPPEEILANKARYFKTAWSVSLWLLIAIIGISAVLLAGLWGVLTIKLNALEASLAASRQSAQGQALGEAEAEARVLKQQLARASAWRGEGSGAKPSALLGAALDRPRGAYLQVFEYGANEGEVALRLEGIAETRAALLAYEKRLRAKADFSLVESPLSNFITASYAEFALTLKVATSTKQL